eukprot:gene7832-9301_t
MTRDSLPRVYFEVSADEISIGQIVFELREDVAPNTTKGFLEACNAEKGFVGAGLDCSAAQFYKMIPIEHSQLDDDNVLKGLQCKDERFELKHDQPGLLSAIGPENESTEATCASAETSSTGSQHEPEDNNAETATVTSDKLKETQMRKEARLSQFEFGGSQELLDLLARDPALISLVYGRHIRCRDSG